MKKGEFKAELARILEDVKASKSASKRKEMALEQRIFELKGRLASREDEVALLKVKLDKMGLRKEYENAVAARRGGAQGREGSKPGIPYAAPPAVPALSSGAPDLALPALPPASFVGDESMASDTRSKGADIGRSPATALNAYPAASATAPAPATPAAQATPPAAAPVASKAVAVPSMEGPKGSPVGTLPRV